MENYFKICFTYSVCIATIVVSRLIGTTFILSISCGRIFLSPGSSFVFSALIPPKPEADTQFLNIPLEKKGKGLITLNDFIMLPGR